MLYQPLGRVWALALALATAIAFAAVAQAGEGSPALTGVVNVNTASAAELQLLPGIGEARARSLIELRKRRGGFKAVEELTDVQGIGDAGLVRLRPFVRLDGKTTAHVQ